MASRTLCSESLIKQAGLRSLFLLLLGVRLVVTLQSSSQGDSEFRGRMRWMRFFTDGKRAVALFGLRDKDRPRWLGELFEEPGILQLAPASSSFTRLLCDFSLENKSSRGGDRRPSGNFGNFKGLPRGGCLFVRLSFGLAEQISMWSPLMQAFITLIFEFFFTESSTAEQNGLNRRREFSCSALL